MADSNAKGKRGEREFAKWVRDTFDLDAERNAQQYKGGGSGNPDVFVPGLDYIHFEVKRNEQIGIGTKLLADAMEQATNDADILVPVVVWRRSRQPWMWTQRIEQRIGCPGTGALWTATAEDAIRAALEQVAIDAKMFESAKDFANKTKGSQE